MGDGIWTYTRGVVKAILEGEYGTMEALVEECGDLAAYLSGVWGLPAIQADMAIDMIVDRLMA